MPRENDGASAIAANSATSADAESGSSSSSSPIPPKSETVPQDRAGAAARGDPDNDDGNESSRENNNQTAGQTTDSAMSQTAGEEAGSEGSAPVPGGEEHKAEEEHMDLVEAAVDNDDANTAPATDSDNDDDDDADEDAKNKKSAISKKKRSSSRYEPPPPFVDDPAKVTLKFIFPNKDGLNVTVDCKPTDTVGEVKGLLLSMWPDELADCSGGNRLRLICMGKGILMPDSRSLEACQVPVFKTHATPVNVAVTPEHIVPGGGGASSKSSKGRAGAGGTGRSGGSGGSGNARRTGGNATTASTGCSCVIS
mmetsp:Transcript_19735/g.43051  ORF Transcript_19735/g.43051 Transcript_19735/m.43051 type:complete len:310 (+) Transcript_19735:545-1474(+)